MKQEILTGLFFVLLCCTGAAQVFAQDDPLDRGRILSSGVDEYGVYILFELPAAQLVGLGKRKADGEIEVSYEGNGGGIYTGTLFKYYGSPESSQVRVICENSGLSAGGIRIKPTHMPPPWSNFMTKDEDETIADPFPMEISIQVRWYMPNELIGKELRFTQKQRFYDAGTFIENKEKILRVDNKSWNRYDPPLPEAALSTAGTSANPGNILVKYVYDETTALPEVTVRHWMDEDIDNKTTDVSNVNPTETLDVTMAAQKKTHTFHSEFIGKGDYMKYSQSQQVMVPPYVWPDQLAAEYDGENKVTLTWNVPMVSGDKGVDYIMENSSKYELIRSADPDFQDFEDIPDMSYIPTQDSYEYEDDLGGLEEGDTVYYRLRRSETADEWGWEEFREIMVPIEINTTLTPDTVILLDGTDRPVAKITWEDFRGVWLDNIKFDIKKLNLTKGTPPEIISITEKEARDGVYLDENISYCNEFVYSLVLNLGGNYDSPSETNVPGSILAVEIGTVAGLSASKGYFPDRTELRWSAQGVFDNYLIKRRVYGSGDNFAQIATVPGSSTNSDIQTDDSKGIPGVYYEYMVVGAVNCNSVTRYSRDTLYTVGFRSPTGTIYGRITYENGQAVEDVSVRLESADNSQLGQSIYLSGNAGSYLKIDSLNTPFANSAFTVEAWVRPDDAQPRNQVIFSQPGQYELGFNGAGQLYFSFKNETITGAYTNQNQSFVHLAGVYGRDSLGLMLNGSLIGIIPCPPQAGGSLDTTVYIGRNTGGSNFKGYIDEMRIWNTGLNPEQVKRDYTRLMAGNEYGLAAYWRFDETVEDQFYDISNVNSSYNRNDGILTAQAVHSHVIPTPDQLSLKAYTDAAGNYMISGVPFTGNGTTYAIVPLLGTHQFDPTSVNRLISSNSLEFTVNFVDKSSFPVSGYVYYKNSTVPVKGVQFQVDGKYAQKDNGALIETDDFGKFTISVPVGTHEVKAIKSNHVFVNDGKITNRFGENLNYQGPVSERILHDSTTVRFIGRVAGGVIQNNYSLGHSLSKNNLGETLSITMELTGAKNRKINSSQTDSIVTVKHLLPSDQDDPSKTHRTRVNFQEYSITIYPDSITGEFVADLIPEDFNVTSVMATGHSSLNLPASLPVNINLTDKFFVQEETHLLQDSITVDTVIYNYAYKFIERNVPVVNVKQVNASGEEMPFFGDEAVTIRMLNNEKDTVQVYDRVENSYFFSYPVFTQNGNYRLKVRAYERYSYFEEADLQEPAFTDQVPTQDGLVSFANDLRYGDSTPDTLSLDQDGQGIYEFQAGNPEIADGIGRKGLSVSVKIGSQVIQWNNGNKLEGYIMGGERTGNDFVTAGPNEMMAVLRDPPGSNSYSYYESGTSTTTEKEYVGSVTQSGDEELDLYMGNSIIIFTGLGAGKIDHTEVNNTAGVKVSHSETFTGKNKSTVVNEFLTRYQTSADPTFIGADADLFIGNSTNITYGSTLNLAIVKNTEVKTGSDVVYFDGSTNGTGYSIVKRTGINIAQKFGTHFVYTAKHIEEVLIPNFIKIRNSVLLPSATTESAAQSIADNTKKQVYVSVLSKDDPNYGATNGDVDAFGAAAEDEPWYNGSSYRIYVPKIPGDNGTGIVLPGFSVNDTVMILNQHIQHWKNELEKNEKAKVEAIALQKNYSFTGGGDVSHVFQTSRSERSEHNFNIILGAAGIITAGAQFNETGVKFTITEGLSTGQGGNFGETTNNTQNFGFVLSESSLDYLSVDVLKAQNNSFVFKTKGGETICPYEGATVTKYYQPGTIIDQPTMRAEIPGITVDKPVASDIPSTRNATYTIELQNTSEADRGVSFFLQVLEDSNPDGAKIYMDGASLATGRAIWINAGQVLQKTITLERGPEAMEYEDIQLRLISECDTTSFDIVNISAYFIPSCSDVHIKSPGDNWLLNTQSLFNDDEERYLPIVIDGFDVSNSLFDNIDIQYKPLAGSAWTSVVKFYADSATFEEAQGAKEMITGSEIKYNLVMSDASFSDQQYEIRAVAACKDNGQPVSTTESNIIRGLKDTYQPRLFGAPQPANGVLGITDEVRLNFNETIAAGLLSYSDFQVTGIRNGTRGDHLVSVRLDGQGDHLATEFNKNLEGKDITVEMWVLADGQANGTLFSHGDINQSMELALTAGNRLEVRVGESVVQSEAPLLYKQGKWAHVALVYNTAASTVSAFYNFIEVIHGAPVTPYTGSGHFEFGRSIGKQGNTFAGAMHEARVWTEALAGTRLQINSMLRLSGAETGLLGYYPMTKGKGNRVFDKAHGSHAVLQGDWTTPPGKAITFNGNGYLELNTAVSPVTDRMDYTMELWFKAEPGQDNAALASNGKGDGNDNGGSHSLFFLGFEDGQLTYRNNGIMVQAEGNYMDNDWHHVAVAVNRNSGTAQLFVDGVLNRYFDANALGGIENPVIYLGARGWYEEEHADNVLFDGHFKGKIDEFRLWNTYLDATFVSNNSNIRLKGDELGLMLYYPFEEYEEHQNNMELKFTLADRKIQKDTATAIPDALNVNAVETDDKAPIKDRGPVDNLQFDYVVNDDGLIINLREPRQVVDKTVVTFRVENVRDMNGNSTASPITWTAYIDRNQLSWSEEEFSLSKKLYAPMEFESYILNKGGSVQRFRLDNLPAWLKASPSSGTIDPQGRQKIVFTVNDGLNVGTYDEIVYMRNDDDEAEALPVRLKVEGEAPGWVVDPADFKYNMTVYGKLRVNGVFSNNEEDMLAAFMNGVCVGVTRNTYNAGNDLWYAFLTVYSNALQYEGLEFRIWDAGTGKTYQAVPSVNVPFNNDAITGTSQSPVIFDGKEMIFREINLSPGWNWISFNLGSPDLGSIQSALANGQWQSGDIVKNETGFNQYSISSGWVGYLEGFNNTSLFMLKTGNAQTLSVGGSPLEIDQTPILIKGNRWNYISYLPGVNMTVQEALAGYPASDEDVIKSQTGFAMYDSRTGWVGNLTYLEPGKGYMLYRKAVSDETLYYPSLTGSLISSAAANRVTESAEALPANLNRLETPVRNNFSFAGNMTLVARVGDEFDMQPWDNLLAYAGGELRGKAKAIDNPASGQQSFFINIAGEEEQPVHFEIERHGKIIARSATILTYRPNSRPGTIREPLVITLENENDNMIVYPNPFGNKVNISIDITGNNAAGTHEVQLSVYDVAGILVFRQPAWHISGNHFRAVWNGRKANGTECLSGVYFINVTVDGVPHVQKVIKVDAYK